LFTNTSVMSINPISFKTLPYDPARHFTAIAMVCSLGQPPCRKNSGARRLFILSARRLRAILPWT
jgi:hypothetical protein